MILCRSLVLILMLVNALAYLGATSLCYNPVPGNTTRPVPQSLAAGTVLPSLRCILQHNNMQRDEIMKLIRHLEQGYLNKSADAAANGLSQITPVSAGKGELLAQVIHLQQRIGSLVDQFQRQKFKNAELERQLDGFAKKDEKSKV